MSIPEILATGAVGALSGLAGVTWGQHLAEKSRKSERVREREILVAELLDEMLATLKVPSMPGSPEAKEMMWEAHGHWSEAWRRSGVLTDAALVDRVAVVGQVLMAGYLETTRGNDPETWVIDAAIRNARQGLAKFRREEDLSPPTFPSSAEMNKLIKLGSAGNDYSQLHEWITAHWDDAD